MAAVLEAVNKVKQELLGEIRQLQVSSYENHPFTSTIRRYLLVILDRICKCLRIDHPLALGCGGCSQWNTEGKCE